jgi:hypothetical protein
MKRTFLNYINNRLTTRRTSQRNEVLFFATAHFLFFNFSASRTSGTFCFAATAQADPKAKQKEPLLPSL